MNSRRYVVLYSVTLLLSASLLFVVQPMFSKMILPLLGGTPQVWNTAMLFFQLLLLGGYAYAHITTKFLDIRKQGILHMSILLLFFLVLPIVIPDGWVPPIDRDPTLWQLSLMAITIGGPFFVLSGSAPMLQRWFSNTDHKDAHNPYFLYGASNLGSMTALLAYPVIIEPSLTLGQQSQYWMYGYICLLLLVLLCVRLAWKKSVNTSKERLDIKMKTTTWVQRGKWLLLAFIPSSLMLGVTTYITTDVASVPLLWIIPLALYVATFIIVFARRPLISEENATNFFAYLLVFMLIYMMLAGSNGIIFVPFHLVLFFFGALVCHMALSSSRPNAENLTEFYLIMSMGGALGGVFNALIAPNLFIIPIEYALVLGAAACMRFANTKQEKAHPLYILAGLMVVGAVTLGIRLESMPIKILLVLSALVGLAVLLNKRWVFGVTVTVILLIAPPGDIWDHFSRDIVHHDRNFFGVMRVIDMENNLRTFVHGTTIHGTQALDKKHEHTPLAYYSHASPIGDMFAFADQQEGIQKVAVLGLGVGVTACYYKGGRSFDFFEIDPGIVAIAENPDYFSFLSGCGSPYTIVQGDARLTLARKEDASYDFILGDAYSSDNIPIHLITLEAIELYLQKLTPNGILGFNISNKYLDIEPILAEISDELNLSGYAKVTWGGKIEGTEIQYNDTHGFAFARNKQQEKFLIENGWSPARKRNGVGVWTDSFSNIIGVIGPFTVGNRMEELRDKEKMGKED